MRAAWKAFKGSKIDSISLGVDVKRCDECQFKFDASIRDDLLVIAGARAAYMDSLGSISIPDGVHEEQELAAHIRNYVDYYLLATGLEDINFDEHIESCLREVYGRDMEDYR
jgi:hypothetical protein